MEFAAALASSALLLATPRAMALDSLKILVPAAPGGGWDQTGRALQADKIVPRVTVDNKGGAGKKGKAGLGDRNFRMRTLRRRFSSMLK